MPMNMPYESNVPNFQQSSSFFERPRLNKLLEKAIDYPMTAVYAGSGYGKTRTIYSFMQKLDAVTSWMQLSERDNVPMRFWENYKNMITSNWPDIGSRMSEFGFPESEDAYAKYASLRSYALLPGHMFYLVFDDFNLLHNPSVLHFFERVAKTLPTNARIIIISRTMPEINMVDMMMQENIFTIREDDLCFTEDEITGYFNQLNLPVSRHDVKDIYDDTHGWAFGVDLIGRSMSKDTKYERYTLMAMKENIFKLIKGEISQIIGKPLWNFLLRISLIDHLPAILVKMLADDDALIKELGILDSYIRYDYHLGVYLIHHLFLEYLRQHQHMLTEGEKLDTYNQAGAWCTENGFVTDALAYYEKAGNYDAIIQTVYHLNLQASMDLAMYANEIFGRIPSDIAARNPLFPAMSLKIMICLGLLEDAAASAERFIKEYEALPDSAQKYRSLASIFCSQAILRMIMSPYTHVYDFDVYFKKMRDCFEKNPYETSGIATKQPVGSYALLVGTSKAGAPDAYIAALRRAVPHCARMLKGNLAGIEDLAQGELYYFQRNMDGAEQYLNMALDKARSNNQYDIQNRSMQYLMQMSFSNGDIATAKNFLSQMEALLDVKEYDARYEAYDIACSHYHIALGHPEKLPDWLKSDFAKCANPAFMEGYANRVRANYHYHTKRYNTLLAFLENARDGHVLLLGRIVFKVLEALSLYKVKRREMAIAALTDAYNLAEPNKIVVPFIQYSKDMRSLTGTALRYGNCSIPKPWLEDINRKSSALSKKLSYIASESMGGHGGGGAIVLTERESKVLRDLSQGLSRTEIAASQELSVNTVKMVINSIYNKLGVSGLHDALRIAISKGLVT